ncbi:MAG: hypothetical protein ISS93_00585 [Candidatus Aenigmarchaeota archaeon]|nr:hypothetical protein [Candidatus Aenigmarchaeota archaeon]
MDIVKEARKLAVSEIDKYGLPNIVHFEISENKAVELAEKLGADKMIVRVGACLMDLKLGQAFKEKRMAEHVAMSVEAAKEFLDQFDIDDASKEKIVNCVEAHHGGPYKCTEAEICANADCYRFIHPKGFFAYLTVLGGGRFTDFTDALNAAEKKMDEKYDVLSLDVCKEELGEYYKTLKGFIEDSKK